MCVGGGTGKYKAQGPASLPHLWPPMASPKGHTRGAPLALPMHNNEQPPANAYAQHNRVTRATGMGHKGVPPQGMIKDMLVMPRCPSHWQISCILAMPKAGWVQHQSQQQAKCLHPNAFLKQPGSTPRGCPLALTSHSQPQKWGGWSCRLCSGDTS